MILEKNTDKYFCVCHTGQSTEFLFGLNPVVLLSYQDCGKKHCCSSMSSIPYCQNTGLKNQMNKKRKNLFRFGDCDGLPLALVTNILLLFLWFC